MSKISITYSKEGVLLKVRPKKFRKLEGKTIQKAICFVNDEDNAERFKEMIDFFNSGIGQIKESCTHYGIKLAD